MIFQYSTLWSKSSLFFWKSDFFKEIKYWNFLQQQEGHFDFVRNLTSTLIGHPVPLTVVAKDPDLSEYRLESSWSVTLYPCVWNDKNKTENAKFGQLFLESATIPTYFGRKSHTLHYNGDLYLSLVCRPAALWKISESLRPIFLERCFQSCSQKYYGAPLQQLLWHQEWHSGKCSGKSFSHFHIKRIFYNFKQNFCFQKIPFDYSFPIF